MESEQKAPVKRFDVWHVAAACLWLEGGDLHIDELTSRILESRLTTLGLKGSRPRQSVCPQLLKHADVFVAYGNGYYTLRSSDFSNNIEVCNAVEWLKARDRRLYPGDKPKDSGNRT